MSDEARLELIQRLDLLLSIYADDLTEVELAEILCATANGVLTLVGERPRWNETDRTVEVPYTEASELESALEALLSTRVICVSAAGIPLLTDIGVRVMCGRESVLLSGRAVQQTPAGVVIQLDQAGIDVQRALVGLPAVLRSNPTEPLVVNRRAVREPALVPPADARRELFPTPSPPATQQHISRPPTVRISVPSVEEPDEPELEERSEVEDRIASSRLRLNAPKIDAALARAGERSHFEFLSVHFSADTDAAEAARDELVELIRQCGEDDHDNALVERLERLAKRVEEAWAVLSVPMTRRKHRADVIGSFQIEAAVEMYERQAESALLSRKTEIAIDCYRRIAELQPSHHAARTNMLALQRFEGE